MTEVYVVIEWREIDSTEYEEVQKAYSTLEAAKAEAERRNDFRNAHVLGSRLRPVEVISTEWRADNSETEAYSEYWSLFQKTSYYGAQRIFSVGVMPVEDA